MIGVSPDWVGNLLLPSTSRLTIRRTGDRYIVSVKEGSVFAELSFDGSSSVEGSRVGRSWYFDRIFASQMVIS